MHAGPGDSASIVRVSQALRSASFLNTVHDTDALEVAIWAAAAGEASPEQLARLEDDRRAAELSHAMDDVNREFGASVVYFGSMFGLRDAAPTRIAFTQIPDFDRVVN